MNLDLGNLIKITGMYHWGKGVIMTKHIVHCVPSILLPILRKKERELC